MTDRPSPKRAVDPTLIALYGATAFVAIVLGVTLSALLFGREPEQRIGGAFELVDHDGRAVDETILDGQLNLVYFGYTNCPDFCPTELMNMAAAQAEVERRGGEVQLLFITVDPERDTPEQLREYVTIFSDSAIGLSGSLEQTSEAARRYGVYWRHLEPDEPGGWYAVDHSLLVYAMDASGRYLTHFGPATDPNLIADQLLGDPSPDGT